MIIISPLQHLKTADPDLIDECIRKWAKGADKNLLALVNDAFKVDKQGKIRSEGNKVMRL